MIYEPYVYLSLISVYSFIAGAVFAGVLTGMRFNKIVTQNPSGVSLGSFIGAFIFSVLWPLTLLITLLKRKRQKVDVQELQRMARLLNETLTKSNQ